MMRFLRSVELIATDASGVLAASLRGRTARSWALLLCALPLASCGAKTDEGLAIGGETHFLVTCGDECGAGLSCIDGACSRPCEPGFSSCSELASEAVCVSGAEDEGEPALFAGTCDVLCSGDGDCSPLGTGFACRAGACRAEPEARQEELSSALSRGFPLVRAVDTTSCETGLSWVGGDHGSAEMRPGSDCVGCHRQTGARPLLLGGTVYATGGVQAPVPLDDCFGLEGVEVTIVDNDGRARSTVTNRAGNFYFEGEESEITMPYQASISWDRGEGETRASMFSMPYYGGCARCHGRAPVGGGRPPGDFEDPEYVIPAGAIFTPGLGE
jgi:hypothetical protein